jgi:hypothetical protein
MKETKTLASQPVTLGGGMKSILTLLTAFFLVALFSFTFSSCKACKDKKSGDPNSTDRVVSNPLDKTPNTSATVSPQKAAQDANAKAQEAQAAVTQSKLDAQKAQEAAEIAKKEAENAQKRTRTQDAQVAADNATKASEDAKTALEATKAQAKLAENAVEYITKLLSDVQSDDKAMAIWTAAKKDAQQALKDANSAVRIAQDAVKVADAAQAEARQTAKDAHKAGGVVDADAYNEKDKCLDVDEESQNEAETLPKEAGIGADALGSAPILPPAHAPAHLADQGSGSTIIYVSQQPAAVLPLVAEGGAGGADAAQPSSVALVQAASHEPELPQTTAEHGVAHNPIDTIVQRTTYL